jgi:hypothetical protein
MEINTNNMGASTYSMKKAMQMPSLMLNLLEQAAESGTQALGIKSPAVTQIREIAESTNKGSIIDLIL